MEQRSIPIIAKSSTGQDCSIVSIDKLSTEEPQIRREYCHMVRHGPAETACIIMHAHIQPIESEISIFVTVKVDTKEK